MTIDEISKKIGKEGYVLSKHIRMGTFYLTLPPATRSTNSGVTDIILSDADGQAWLDAEPRRTLPRTSTDSVLGCDELGLDWVNHTFHCFIQ